MVMNGPFCGYGILTKTTPLLLMIAVCIVNTVLGSLVDTDREQMSTKQTFVYFTIVWSVQAALWLVATIIVMFHWCSNKSEAPLDEAGNRTYFAMWAFFAIHLYFFLWAVKIYNRTDANIDTDKYFWSSVSSLSIVSMLFSLYAFFTPMHYNYGATSSYSSGSKKPYNR